MREEIIDGFRITFLDRQNFQIKMNWHRIHIEYNPKVNSYIVKGGVFGTRDMPGYYPIRDQKDRSWVENAISCVARRQNVSRYEVLYEE